MGNSLIGFLGMILAVMVLTAAAMVLAALNQSTEGFILATIVAMAVLSYAVRRELRSQHLYRREQR